MRFIPDLYRGTAGGTLLSAPWSWLPMTSPCWSHRCSTALAPVEASRTRRVTSAEDDHRRNGLERPEGPAINRWGQTADTWSDHATWVRGVCWVVSECGAQCVSSARWDLCGGPSARAVPTAMAVSRRV